MLACTKHELESGFPKHHAGPNTLSDTEGLYDEIKVNNGMFASLGERERPRPVPVSARRAKEGDEHEFWGLASL